MSVWRKGNEHFTLLACCKCLLDKTESEGNVSPVVEYLTDREGRKR